MIYAPSVAGLLAMMTLRDAAAQSLGAVAIAAATDFVSQENKPWQYYAGVGLGAGVAAVGTPNASAVMYVAGETFRVHVLKNPDGGEMDIFLNGVRAATIGLYSASTLWEMVEINVGVGGSGDPPSRVEFFNLAAGAALFSWLALGPPFEVIGGQERILSASSVRESPWEINYKIKDAKNKRSTTRVYYPAAADDQTALAYAETMQQALGSGVIPLVTGEIESVSITRDIALPPDLKTAPLPVADLAEKMRFDLVTEDGSKARLSVPTWSNTYTRPDENAKKRWVAPTGPADKLLRLLLTGLDDELRPCDQRGDKFNPRSYDLRYPSMRWFD